MTGNDWERSVNKEELFIKSEIVIQKVGGGNERLRYIRGYLGNEYMTLMEGEKVSKRTVLLGTSIRKEKVCVKRMRKAAH